MRELSNNRSASVRPMLKLCVLTALMLISSVIVLPHPSSAAAPTSWYATITNVVDGDTFDVAWDAGDEHPDGLTRIRVAGLDTNETATNECMANDAKLLLQSILPIGTHVRLEANSLGSESQGRPIRHAFIGASYDQNVALPVIDAGLALPVSFKDEPDYQDTYFNHGEVAKTNEVGMWADAACGGPPNATVGAAIRVNYDAAGNDNTNLNDEYIEVRNISSTTLDLTGWTMRSSARLDGGTFAFPAGSDSIAPGAKLTIRSGSGTNSSTEIFLGYSEAWLSNSSDVVYLRDDVLNIRASKFWPCTVSCEPAQSVVVDTVHYNAPGNDLTNPSGEWLRVRNAGALAVDLDGWRVKAAGLDYVFPVMQLAPGGVLTINIGSGANTASTLYWGNSSGILPNSSGDQRVRVTAPSGIEVDCYAWGSSECIDENPGGAIRFFANFNATGNDTTNPNGEWVALWNTSDTSINLGGYTVTNDGHEYTFDGDVVLTPNRNIRLFIGSGTDTTHRKYWGLGEGILRNSGDEVELEEPAGSVILRHEWPCVTQCQPDASGFVIDHVNYRAPGVSSSDPAIEWIRIRNASQVTQNFRNWKVVAGGYQLASISSRSVAPGGTIMVHIESGTNTSTDVFWNKSSPILSDSGFRAVQLLAPDRSMVDCHAWGTNSCATQSQAAGLVVTANFNADGDDATNPNGEWINIRNVSSSTIDLSSLYVYTDGTSYEIPAGTTVAEDERVRIRFGSGTNSATELFAGGVLNPLSNVADDVYLRSDATDWDVASFSYPCAIDCAHDLFAIGDINVDAPGYDSENPNGEWIEIRNTGSKSARLTDWRLQYQTGTFLDFDGPEYVAAGATVTVFIGSGTDTSSSVYWGKSAGILSNTSGSLKLLSPQRDTVDTDSW